MLKTGSISNQPRRSKTTQDTYKLINEEPQVESGVVDEDEDEPTEE